MIITPREYQANLASFYAYDCAVLDKHQFVLSMDRWFTDEEVEEEELNRWDPRFRTKRLVFFIRGLPEGKRIGGIELDEWSHMEIGAGLHPNKQFVAVELENDRVYVHGSGESFEDAALDKTMKNNPLARGGVMKLKTIDGFLYICGTGRCLGKRIDNGQWLSFNDNLEKIKGAGISQGFTDLDGFSETDIYAAGGDGDVWHFNGETWRQIPFPSNLPIRSLCCGGDGLVYISAYEGKTFVGRDNRWEQIYPGGITMGFNDMVWHDGCVWCSNDYGIWQIHDGKTLSPANHLPSEVRACSGHLYVNDGVLMVAGLGGAAIHVDGEWEIVYLRAEMERAIAALQNDEST